MLLKIISLVLHFLSVRFLQALQPIQLALRLCHFRVSIRKMTEFCSLLALMSELVFSLIQFVKPPQRNLRVNVHLRNQIDILACFFSINIHGASIVLDFSLRPYYISLR